MRLRPAPLNCFWQRLAPPRFPLFLSRRFVGGGLVSTERFIPAAPATPARSARCRSPRQRAPSIADIAIDRPRLDLPARAADRGGRARPLLDMAHPGSLGRLRPPARRLDDAAAALAYAAVAARSVIDVEAVVIDGAMPPDVRERLCLRWRRGSKRSTGTAFGGDVVAGSIGADAPRHRRRRAAAD